MDNNLPDIRGWEIRTARKALGWTQKVLTEKVNQAMDEEKKKIFGNKGFPIKLTVLRLSDIECSGGRNRVMVEFITFITKILKKPLKELNASSRIRMHSQSSDWYDCPVSTEHLSRLIVMVQNQENSQNKPVTVRQAIYLLKTAIQP